MARILALSSQVVSGRVGLSVIQPALQQRGHEVLAVPTILLSNHPGQQAASGTRIDPGVLDAMFATLEANGRLAGIDAILTGYLPSPAHVAAAARAVDRCRAVATAPLPLPYLCDPVIGDDPKGMYIDPAAAAALRETLLPRADIVTPNRFELAWLTGATVDGPATAIAAARSLARPVVLATSIPMEGDRLGTVAVTADSAALASVNQRTSVPNGTGDLLAALFLARYLTSGRNIAVALAEAVAEVDRIIAASSGRSELNLFPAKPS